MIVETFHETSLQPRDIKGGNRCGFGINPHSAMQRRVPHSPASRCSKVVSKAECGGVILLD